LGILTEDKHSFNLGPSP